MTEIQSTRSAAVLAGMGIANNRHEGLIEAPGRTRRRRGAMLSPRADFDRPTTRFVDHDRPVRVAFEGQTTGLAAIAALRSPDA